MTYTPVARMRWAVAAVLLAVAVPSVAQAQARPPLEVIKLRDNVHAIVGGGATVVLQVGQDGAILVDSGSG